MRRLLRAAAALLCALAARDACAQTAPAGFVTVTESSLVNAANVPVSNATACAQINVSNVPIGANITVGKTVVKSKVCAPVVSGAYTLTLPNTNLTRPKHLQFMLTVTDNVSGRSLLDAGYDKLQPSSIDSTDQVNNPDGGYGWCTGTAGGSVTCNLDNYTPNQPALAVLQSGPKGEKGDKGDSVVGPAGQAGTVTASGVNGDFAVPGSLAATRLRGNNTQGVSVVADPTANAQASMSSLLSANKTVGGGRTCYAAGSTYPGCYASDGAIAMDDWPAGFSATEMRNLADALLAAVDGSGHIPNGVQPDGTGPAFYSSWDNAHNGVMMEGALLTPWAEYTAFKKDGSTSHFITNHAKYETALALLPTDSNHLIYSDPAHPQIAWGFQEWPGITGDLMGGSTFAYITYLRMAEMYTAAGDSADASAASAKAAQIKASIGTLWSASDGMFHAGTASGNQIDVYFSALAASSGLATTAQATSVSNYLVANFETIFQDGAALPTVNSATNNNWTSFGYLQANATRSGGSYGPGQYQAGRWSVANKWMLQAMALTSPATARRYAESQINDAYPYQEWFNVDQTTGADSPAGNNTNLESPMGAGGYIVSLGLPTVPNGSADGANDNYVANGYSLQDGRRVRKMRNFSGDATDIIEGSLSAQRWHCVTGIGCSSQRLDSAGILHYTYQPFRGSAFDFAAVDATGKMTIPTLAGTTLSYTNVGGQNHNIADTGTSFVNLSYAGGVLTAKDCPSGTCNSAAPLLTLSQANGLGVSQLSVSGNTAGTLGVIRNLNAGGISGYSFTDSSNGTAGIFGYNSGYSALTGTVGSLFFLTVGHPICFSTAVTGGCAFSVSTTYGVTNKPLYTPSSSTAPCTTGDEGADAGFYYKCTAPNTWKRAALSPF